MPAHSTDRSTRTDEPAVRIPVDLRLYPGIRRLAVDYSCDFQAVAPFFSGNPGDRAAWARAMTRTQAHRRPRQAIASIVAAQQRHRGAPGPALEAGRRLGDERAVAVLTGQQAGLFGGPLYTLLKALTALKVADQVSRDHGVAAVAVFWVDAEDHDWDEVRGCTVFDESLTPRHVALPADAVAASVPIASVRLDDSIGAVLDELEGLLPSSEFKQAVLEDLRQAYAPGTRMVDAFGRWLERLLGDRGLVVYDSSDPASKHLALDIFARELSTPGETVRLAARAGSELAARGYHSQVQTADDSLALFHLDDGSRQPIRRRDGAFAVGDRHYPAAELLREATQHPSHFSPSVLLRPIVQDAIFPTICYVAGPSELAYLGQLRAVYEHFDVPMPIMYPRATSTILDAAAVRFLSKYRVPLEALQRQDEAGLNDLLERQIPAEVEEAFTATSLAVDSKMSRLIDAVPALEPTLDGAARSTLKRMQQDLETLHGKMIQAAKRRDETLRRQYLRTQALAFPGGHAQERSIGFVSFLNQYGRTLIDRLDEELPLELGRHWMVRI